MRTRPGVWVPRAAGRLPAAALAVLVVLLACARHGTAQVHQDHLMRRIGKGAAATPDTVRRAVQVLVEDGWVRARRVLYAPTRYTLLRCPAPGTVEFSVVPHALVRAVEDRRIGAQVLATWLVLDQVLGLRGWSQTTPADLAARAGVSPATISRHLRQLQELDLLARPAPGYFEIGPAADPDRHRPPQLPLDRPTQDLPGPPDPVGQPVTDARSGLSPMPDPLRTTPALETPPPTPDPALAPCAHRGVPARASTSTGGTPQHQTPPRRRQPHPDLGQVLSAIPAHRLDTQRRWLPGIRAALTTALNQGLPAPVLHHALTHFLDHAHPRLLPAVRTAIRIARTDQRLGLACPHCGTPRPGPHTPCLSCDQAAIAAVLAQTITAWDPPPTRPDPPPHIPTRTGVGGATGPVRTS